MRARTADHRVTMRARLRVVAVMALVADATAATDVYQYLGNGYCLSGPTSPPAVRPTTIMCDAAGGSGSCDEQKCSCLVESGGQECATVCEDTEGCTGFMVQDSLMYAKGLAHVCQIVSNAMPADPPVRHHAFEPPR